MGVEFGVLRDQKGKHVEGLITLTENAEQEVILSLFPFNYKFRKGMQPFCNCQNFNP